MDYAHGKKGYPLYFLYNSLTSQKAIEKITNNTSYNPEMYGVSFTSAIYIKREFQKKLKNSKGESIWHIPSFHDLHPEFAKPFQYFSSSYQNKLFTDEIIDMFFQFPSVDYDLATFSEDELLNDDDWVDLTPNNNNLKSEPIKDIAENANLIYTKKSAPIEQSKTQNSKNRFNPRFRLILSNNDTTLREE
ncbi:hypothetical protein Q4Q34_07230 [Flavivirga abyssicola]|uniref:hypothetical protein n=1 Tax=Flavivirga abyssicola TaxID=3063533 RepID=UPI0026E08181|nr:hypothetical protein [Flavivirga sp. MEBiC07777]WVK14819.1 hypothetical protein Q4Q34_07230 [Flavivirga sp. MEBiC07777]